MTDTNDKLRAVILSALMVVSVFGATVAFSGSAAAATTDVSGGGDALQTAIGNAAGGDTLVIQDSKTYNPVTIDKELTITTADGATPTIESSTGGTAAVVVTSSVAVTLDGLEIVGADNTHVVDASALGGTTTLTVGNSTIDASSDASTNAFGILLDTGGNVDVSNVDFVGDSDADETAGIRTKNGAGAGSTITESTFTNVDFGVQFAGVGDLRIDNSTFTSIEDEAILVNANGAGVSGAVTIADVTVDGATHGVYFAEDDSGSFTGSLTVNRSNFMSISGYGVIANDVYGSEDTADDFSTTVTAVNNYWGSISGPSGDGSGDGVTVDASADVTYTPWSQEQLDTSGPAIDEIAEVGGDIYVTFTEPVTDGSDNALQNDDVDVYVDGAKQSGLSYTTTSNNGHLKITGLSDVDPSQTVKVNIPELYDAGDSKTTDINQSATLTGATLTLEDTETNSVSPSSVGSDHNLTTYTGTKVAVFFPSTPYDLDAQYERYIDGQVQFSGTAGTFSRVVVFDTEDMTQMQSFRADPNNDDSQVEAAGNIILRDLGLSASATQSEYDYGSPVQVDISAKAGNRGVTAALKNADGDTVASDSITLDGSGDASIDFGAQDAGNYTVEVTDVNSGVTASTDNIHVKDEVTTNGEAILSPKTVTATQGGIANITVDFQDTQDVAYLVLGNETSSDQNYEVHIKVEADERGGETTVHFNTYSTVDNNEPIVTSTGGEASVESYSEVATVVDAGTYNLKVKGDSQNNFNKSITQPDSVGSITLQSRNTEDSSSVWVAPSGTSFDSVSGIQTAIENGNLTTGNTVAYGDVVVSKFHADGLEGAWEFARNEEGSNKAALKFLNDSRNLIAFNISQTNAGPNAKPKILDFAQSDFSVVTAEGNNTFYVVAESDQLRFNQGSTPNLDPGAGERFKVSWAVNQTELGDSASTSNERFNVETAEFDVEYMGDYLTLQPTTETITAATNFAPGTEFTVRVQSTTTGDQYYTGKRTYVEQHQNGRDLHAAFDLSSLNNQTNLTITVQRAGGDSMQVPGRIVVQPDASIEFSDQESGGSVVSVDGAYVPDGGFVAIKNADGNVVGHTAYLAAGTYSPNIALDSALDSDAELTAAVIQDSDDNQAFDASADSAYEASDGEDVVDDAQITVAGSGGGDDTTTPDDTPTEDTTEDTPTEDTTGDSGTTDEDEETTEDNTGGGTPGFTVALALVAVIAAALLAIRRDQ